MSARKSLSTVKSGRKDAAKTRRTARRIDQMATRKTIEKWVRSQVQIPLDAIKHSIEEIEGNIELICSAIDKVFTDLGATRRKIDEQIPELIRLLKLALPHLANLSPSEKSSFRPGAMIIKVGITDVININGLWFFATGEVFGKELSPLRGKRRG